jgi:hypothetical protein
VGFVAMSLTLISGQFMRSSLGSFWSWIPRKLHLDYLGIIWFCELPATTKWRGRRAAYISILGFISTLMTFGVNWGLHRYYKKLLIAGKFFCLSTRPPAKIKAQDVMFNLLLWVKSSDRKVDIRQRASFNAEQLPEGLRRLAESPGIQESMILSTCNRVEILSRAEPQPEGAAAIESFLSQYSGIPLSQLQPALYRYEDEAAVRHVFRVASSLDSMILGEPQILGQLKSCYAIAVDARTVGAFLNGLLQSAFRIAKRVRSETSIGEYPVSVSSAAVELVRKIFGDLQKNSILIVGAGKWGGGYRHLATPTLRLS